MTTWLAIITLSALAGLGCSHFLSGRFGLICSGAIPWLGLLAWLLYLEYFVPYQSGGASMWPVAQLFAGTIAASIGLTTFWYVKRLKMK